MKNKVCFKIKPRLSISGSTECQTASRLGTKSEQTLPSQIKFSVGAGLFHLTQIKFLNIHIHNPSKNCLDKGRYILFGEARGGKTSGRILLISEGGSKAG